MQWCSLSNVFTDVKLELGKVRGTLKHPEMRNGGRPISSIQRAGELPDAIVSLNQHHVSSQTGWETGRKWKILQGRLCKDTGDADRREVLGEESRQKYSHRFCTQSGLVAVLLSIVNLDKCSNPI